MDEKDLSQQLVLQLARIANALERMNDEGIVMLAAGGEINEN